MTNPVLKEKIPKSMVIERFSISVWFSCLFAVSFSAAIFGLYGLSAGLGMLLLAFIASFISLFFAYQNRHTKDALKVPADSIAIIGLIFFFVALFEHNLVVALIEMLFFLQIALNLYFREHRQVYFGLIACFVALMSGAIHTFRSGFLLYILLFCIFASFYLAESYIDKKLAQQNFLQRLLAKPETKTEESTNADSPEHQHTNMDTGALKSLISFGQWSIGRRFALVISICFISAIIYLLIPRFPPGNIGSSALKGWGNYEGNANQLLDANADLDDKFYKTPEQGAGQDTDNFDDTDNGTNGNPFESGNSEQDNQGNNKSESQYLWDKEIYFYVKSDQPRYLQLQTKTYFDGQSWYGLQYAYKHIKHSRDRRLYELYPAKPNNVIDVTVAKDIPTSIVGTANTVALAFPSQDVGKDYYDGLTTTQNLVKDTFYQLHVLDEYYQNRLIDRFQAPPDNKDLQLPKNLDPRVRHLAEEITLGAKDDWQKALRLEQHMRTQYEYSLETLANQNNIPVVDFLFHDKKGHCEYFATALALMLRTQGIPTRMISGFVAEDNNPITGYYEVKGINGHAWVQAYITHPSQNHGAWITFEGTGAYQPPVEDPNKEKSAEEQNRYENTHQRLKDYLEHLEQQESRLEEKPKTFSEYLRDFCYSLLLGLDMLWQAFKQILPFLFGLVVILIGLYFAMRLPHVKERWLQIKNAWLNKRGLKQLKKHRPADNKADTLVYMKMIQDLLERHGINRASGDVINLFTGTLIAYKLIDTDTQTWLNDHISQTFYQTDISVQTETDPDELHQAFLMLYQHILEQLANHQK